MNPIRFYDGLVQARGALSRSIKHCADKKYLKTLLKMYKELDKKIKEIRKRVTILKGE